MALSDLDKRRIKLDLAACLRGEKEVRKVVVFGSFLSSREPQDVDVAVFEDGPEGYLALALKYRRLTRTIADRIPVDIIPLRNGATGPFLSEVDRGEVIYER